MLFFNQNKIRRHGQVVRHRSAKPLFLGSNPSGASKTKSTAIAVLFVLEMLPHPSATSVDGSNLETTKKRLSIVFSKFLSPKQGALRVECIETKKGDYATRVVWASHLTLCIIYAIINPRMAVELCIKYMKMMML